MNPEWKETLQIPFKQMVDQVKIMCISYSSQIIGTFNFTIKELTLNKKIGHKEWFHVKSNEKTTAHILLESKFTLINLDLLPLPTAKDF